jgi:hypothetical protein
MLLENSCHSNKAVLMYPLGRSYIVSPQLRKSFTFSFSSCREKNSLKTISFLTPNPNPTLTVAYTNFCFILIMSQQQSNENLPDFSAEVKRGYPSLGIYLLIILNCFLCRFRHYRLEGMPNRHRIFYYFVNSRFSNIPVAKCTKKNLRI